MARWNNNQRAVHKGFGEELQKLRAEHRFTFQEVSNQSGLGVQTIFSLEVGVLAPRLDHVADLYRVYGQQILQVVSKTVIKFGGEA